jgi:3'-5' exoribonuclease
MAEQEQLTSEPTNGHRNVRELSDGDPVESIFVVRERTLAQKRNGDDYLRLKLGDRTGVVPAVAWDDAEDLFRTAEPGAVVRVGGRFSKHPQFGPQIKISSIQPADDAEFSPEELVEAPAETPEQLERNLRELIATIQNPQLQALLERFYGQQSEIWRRFREAPAAKLYHEAYPGGLLEHTVSVAQAVSATSGCFPGIDRDVAVTGALLHDIGKTQAYNDDPLAIELTDDGRLQGEIPLGYYMVRRELEAIPDFDPRLAQAVLHIILSHHGALEHGSPVVPATREATLVHMIDNLGGRLGTFDRLERELPEGESWSGWDRALEGSAYFASRAA